MRYSVVVEKVSGLGGPEGLFYASVPSLGLVTHGADVESALAAAKDLATLWLAGKWEHEEPVPEGGEALLGTIEVSFSRPRIGSPG
jgi:predicted RNase H-like HicB family nuclease